MSSRRSIPSEVDGASPGKIFIGGLAKDTTLDMFNRYFGRYGEIIDSVIMKDRYTGRPRGFGFITYADPAVVDVVMQEDHVINGKPVEIKRTIPKGAQGNDFKTKKIFVGGIPTALTEDEFKEFFSKYGKVAEHEIIYDHVTKRSRGFGFIVFDSEKVVDDILAGGNMIDMNDIRVEVKKAEPKSSSNPAPGPAFGSEPRARSYGDGFRGFQDSYAGYGGGFSPASYRAYGGFGSRFGDYGAYGGGEFGSGYGSYGGGGYGSFQGDFPMGYSGRYGSYGGSGLGGSGYGSMGALGAYGRGSDGGYGVPGPMSGYGSGPGAYGGGAAGAYGSRSGYGSGSRYHPYAR